MLWKEKSKRIQLPRTNIVTIRWRFITSALRRGSATRYFLTRNDLVLWSCRISKLDFFWWKSLLSFIVFRFLKSILKDFKVVKFGVSSRTMLLNSQQTSGSLKLSILSYLLQELVRSLLFHKCFFRKNKKLNETQHHQRLIISSTNYFTTTLY